MKVGAGTCLVYGIPGVGNGLESAQPGGIILVEEQDTANGRIDRHPDNAVEAGQAVGKLRCFLKGQFFIQL